MSTILVTGATGKQGGAVVDALLQLSPKPNVKALSRNPDSPAASALKSRGVTVVKGNMTDLDSLVQALDGVDGAFLVTDFNQDGLEAEVKQGKTFVDAVKSSSENGKPKHLVFSSVGSANDAPEVPHFKSKFQVEEYLRSTLGNAGQVSWTILRPVAFMDNFPIASAVGTAGAASFFKSLMDTDRKLQFVSCRDIGKVAAQVLAAADKHKGRTIELAGDEKTVPEVLETFGQYGGGKPWTLPFPRFISQKLGGNEMAQMFKWFNTTGYKADIPSLRSEFPDLWSWKEYIQSAQK